MLRARARGHRSAPGAPARAARGVQRLAHTLATDTNDLGVLHALLRALTERLGRRLRRGGLAAGGCGWRSPTPITPTVARALPLRASALDAELWDAARRAFTLANGKRLAVRAVAVTLDRLLEAEAQLELFDGARARRDGCPGRSAVSNTPSIASAPATAPERSGSSTSVPGNHHLPERLVGLHQPVRFGDPGHRVGALQHRAERRRRARSAGRRAAASARELRTSGTRSSSVRVRIDRPDHLQPLAQDRTEIGGRPAAGEKAEQHQPSAGREHREVVRERRTAEHVEDHVHRSPIASAKELRLVSMPTSSP